MVALPACVSPDPVRSASSSSTREADDIDKRAGNEKSEGDSTSTEKSVDGTTGGTNGGGYSDSTAPEPELTVVMEVVH